MNYACIIPCFNEGERIKELISELESIDSSYIDWFLVDNGSFDSSFDFIFKNNQKKFYKNINFIRKSTNEGYGNGIKYGLNQIKNFKKSKKNTNIIFNSYSNYFALGWTHADGQTPVFDLISATRQADQISTNEYLVKGIRNTREDGLISTIFTSFLNLIIFTIFSKNCINPNSQPTLVSKDLLFRILDDASNDGSFDLSILLKSTKYKISYSRFPIKFLKRKRGLGSNESIYQKVKYSIALLIFLWGKRRFSKFYNIF